MKKILILMCGVLFFATSCLDNGGSTGSSSATFYGTIVVTDDATGEVAYSSDEASVDVVIPNIIEAKMDILFNGVKFADMMPKVNMQLGGLPFVTTISEDGTSMNYVVDAKDVVPTIGGVPYEKYKADKVEGCVGATVDIRFTLESKGMSVHFTNAKKE